MDFSFIPARQRSTSIPILYKVVEQAESKKTMIKAKGLQILDCKPLLSVGIGYKSIQFTQP